MKIGSSSDWPPALAIKDLLPGRLAGYLSQLFGQPARIKLCWTTWKVLFVKFQGAACPDIPWVD